MSIISVTDNAADHIRDMMAKNDKAIGFRLGTNTQGCNGLSYTIDYVVNALEDDEIVETGGVKIFVARTDLLHLMGTRIDWEDSMFSTGFSFTNPNESGRCGCGESFTV